MLETPSKPKPLKKAAEIISLISNTANDPDKFWPHGIRLLPNPEIYVKSLAEQIDKFISDESTEVNLPLEKINLKNAVSILPLFLSIISCPNIAEANDLERKKIEWVIQMTESIDKLDILISKSEKNARANESYKFSAEDKNILAWNIFHEARGETQQGQKLVLLTVLNRMLSPNYPASVSGVVFRHMHFTWANRILEQENFLSKDSPTNPEVKSFLNIREMLENLIQEKNIRELKTFLLAELGLPENLHNICNYHVYGMWSTPEMRTRYKWEQNSLATRKRLLVADWLSQNPTHSMAKYVYKDPTGKHIFFTNEINTPEALESIFSQMPAEIRNQL